MNKFIFLFLVLIAFGITATAVDKVATGDPVKPGQIKLSGTIVQSNGDLVFPASVFITNGTLTASITNVSFANITGVTNFQGSTNLIAPYLVQGITNTTGAPDAAKLVKTGADGKIDNSFINLTSNIIDASTTYLPVNIGVSTTYTNLIVVTNNILSGIRLISSQAGYSDADAGGATALVFARLLELSVNLATTNVIASAGISTTVGNYYEAPLGMAMVARVASATNIYVLQGMQATAGDTSDKFRVSGTSTVSPNPAFSNMNWITIINVR